MSGRMGAALILFTLGAVLAGALPLGLEAQVARESKPSFWATGGLGGSIWTGGQELSENNDGIVVVGQLSVQTGPHLVSLRSSLIWELFGDALADVGVLYGRATRGDTSHASVSTGLAWVYADDCTDGLFSGGGCRVRNTIGVPIVVEGSLRPLRFLGIGAQAFVNLNSVHSMLGFAVVAQLGALY